MPAGPAYGGYRAKESSASATGKGGGAEAVEAAPPDPAAAANGGVPELADDDDPGNGPLKSVTCGDRAMPPGPATPLLGIEWEYAECAPGVARMSVTVRYMSVT